MAINELELAPWGMERQEYGLLVDTGHSISTSPPFRLYIPKITPFQGSDYQTHPTSLSDSCFVNSTECQVKSAKIINRQSFRTLQTKAHVSFTFEHFSQGDKLQIEVEGGDPDKMWVTNKLDPSHTH